MVPSPTLIIATAEELHKTYRAAFKALHQGGTRFVDGTGCSAEHDHGFSSCGRKPYFLRRAVRFWKDLALRIQPTTPF